MQVSHAFLSQTEMSSVEDPDEGPNQDQVCLLWSMVLNSILVLLKSDVFHMYPSLFMIA